jgi:hypothetical protein
MSASTPHRTQEVAGSSPASSITVNPLQIQMILPVARVSSRAGFQSALGRDAIAPRSLAPSQLILVDDAHSAFGSAKKCARTRTRSAFLPGACTRSPQSALITRLASARARQK